ncbi:hypothetical protein KA037_04770 [Patescibacteria group bacterium]|nr:hypothetical protein [Patescibacteria group bacterium]MBP7841946.1 hypothetical protein [Patescibacteria group bacterium]
MIMTNSNNTTRTKCEIYTRVMGYYRPVSHFNIGKKSEFYSRNYFIEPQKESLTPNQKFNDTYCATPTIQK